jgi:hypothetical protein
MTEPTPTPRPLRDLHDTYVERVNVAISEGHDDQAAQLADDFEDAVRDAVLTQRRVAAS